MEKLIDIKGLAKKIARETFVFKKLNVCQEYYDIGIFNNFSYDDVIELGKQLNKETRKYKLKKINNEKEL